MQELDLLNFTLLLQVFDKLVSEAGKRGILIMLDCHHLSIAGGITELWYDGTTSEAQLIQAWTTIITRYRSAWNVFAGMNLHPANLVSGNLSTSQSSPVRHCLSSHPFCLPS